MTLTYRGQKYDQQKVAGASDKPALTYRGVSYAKWSRLNQKIPTPALGGGFFMPLRQRRPRKRRWAG